MVFRGPFKFDFQTLPNGKLVWNCSLVMLNYFEKLGPEFWRGKKVVELGAGSGDLGYGVSLLGADVLCTEMPGEVYQTLQEAVEERESRIERKHGGSIRCQPLLWGEEGWNANPIEGTFDIVINADLIYNGETHDVLRWTWHKLCTEQTRIHNIFVNRLFSWNFFVHLDDSKLFEVDQIEDFDALGMDDIHMHIVRLKAPSERIASEKERTNTETPRIPSATDKKIAQDDVKENTAKDVSTDDKKDNEEISIFELLDQFLGVSAETLRKWIHICIAILTIIATVFTGQAYLKGDTQTALLHGGYFVILLGLGGSVNFVLYEAERIQKATKIE